MVQITSGEGGTFSGDTAEKKAMQAITWWCLQEENESINPNEEEYFSGTKNQETKFFEGAWKIPATLNPTLTIIAGVIYPGVSFIPGTGGTFKGETAEAQTLEILLWLIQKQNDTTNSNPDKFEYVTGIYNANSNMWEGTFKLPYQTILLPNGGTQDIARAYLL